MPRPAPTTSTRAVVVLALLHVGLGLWALRAWIHGPFRGEGILDGAEVLQLARTGSAGPFETKSPLYPWLLARAFELCGDSPWTVGALGLATSVALLVGIARLCDALRRPEAAPWAAGLYALSGSAIVFAVQPLPVLLAPALLLGGLVAAVRAGDSGRARGGLLAGLLLGASAFTRAPLLIPAGLVVLWLAGRRRRASAAAAVGGLVLVAAACFAAFGARAWPSGSMLNLRMGNGAQRSGFSDVRPGPAYDRVRLEAAFAAPAARGTPPDFERFQRDALLSEVRADPAGAAATLARKAYLFWFRTETVTAADFRHGLRGFPLAALLLLSFGVVAPLALASLVRWRPAALWLPLLGLFAVNVVWLTSARYRFPALPLACVAAGAFVAARPPGREWLLALALAVPLNVHLGSRPLTVVGDGLVQEGRLLLQRGAEGDDAQELTRARRALEQAIAAGSRDPRARYELALACDKAGGRDPARVERHYREALELDPGYPEAAENLMALLLEQDRDEDALALGERLIVTSPHAAKVWLNLAVARRRLDPAADVDDLEAQGFLRLALRSLAQGDEAGFARWAAEARRRGVRDPRLDALDG